MTPYYADDLVTLYHGDCREVLPTLPPVDSLITDPPYGLNLGYGRTALGVRRIVGDEDAGLYAWMLAHAPSVMHDEAWGVVFCGYSQVGAVQDAAQSAGFGVKTVIVWDKQMPSLGEGIRNQHELAVLLRRGMPSERYVGGNVWRFTRERGRPEHPHMKPQAIMLRLVDYYSPPPRNGSRPVRGQRLDSCRREGAGAQGHRHRDRRGVLRADCRTPRTRGTRLHGGNGMSDTCKRGHERSAENSRERTVNSGGKTRVITECLACARDAKARKAALRSESPQLA